MRIFAIGDVHGRADLLAEMHWRIAMDLAVNPPGDWRVIHLGDYVDRGPDSRGVIEMLIAANAKDPRFMSLAGNHDVGFVDFLGQPDKSGLFARFGGYETARSYGVDADFSSDGLSRSTADALLSVMPREHLDFLSDLPRCVTFGDFFFCHAGVRPGVPLDKQSPDDLIWIRGEFHRWPGMFDKVIVHGHTPHHEPEILPNRVNVDTEAWRSGALTALVVDGRDKRLTQVVTPTN
jgi:serine/threonine protein phosphatase 1